MIAPTAIPQIPVDVTQLGNSGTEPTGFREAYILYTILNAIQPGLGNSWLQTYPQDRQPFLSTYFDVQVPEYEPTFQTAVQAAASAVRDAINLGAGDPLPAIIDALNATNSISPLVAPFVQILTQYLSIQNLPNGTSMSTDVYPSGSAVTSVTTTYNASNGMGGLATEDQENSNGTSQITTYTSTGYTEETYSSPHGTGSVIGSVVDNGDGEIETYNGAPGDGTPVATTAVVPEGPYWAGGSGDLTSNWLIGYTEEENTSTNLWTFVGGLYGEPANDSEYLYFTTEITGVSELGGTLSGSLSLPGAKLYDYGSVPYVLTGQLTVGEAFFYAAVGAQGWSVEGPGILTLTDAIVGYEPGPLELSPAASLAITNGGSVLTSDLEIGTGGSGACSVIGNGSALTVNDGTADGTFYFIVGDSSAGKLDIESGGSAFVAGNMQIGFTNPGETMVTGLGSTLTVVGTLDVGFDSSATLDIVDGGGVSAASVVVGAAGTITLAGGALNTDPVTIDADGNITGYGTITGGETVDGTITASGGTLDVTGDISGSGTLTFDAGASLSLEGTVAATESLVFNAPNEILLIGTAAAVSSPISGFESFDAIGLAGQTITSAVYDTRTNVLAVTGSSGGTYDLNFPGNYQQSDFPVVNGEIVMPCFLRGTRIATPCGEILIEELAIGDLVQANDAGLAPVKWIGHRRVDCRHHLKPQKVWPVRVRANAFGKGIPHSDLWLSPDHAVFVSDVLIPIKHLINGTSIEQVPVDEVTYYHVELEHHDVLLAEGLPAESYLDTGDRCNFENDGRLIALHPDFATRSSDAVAVWEAYGCAPLVVTGPVVVAVRAQLLQRAAKLAMHSARRPRKTGHRRVA